MRWQEMENELVDALKRQMVGAFQGASGDWYVEEGEEVNLTLLAREMAEYKGFQK